MNDRHRTLFYLMDRITDIGDEYSRIKADEEERENSTRIGKYAIKYNIIYLIIMAIVAGLTVWAIYYFSTSHVFLGILLLVIGISFFLFSIVYAILSFYCDILQMRLNKKPIGLGSLIFTLLIIFAFIAGIAVSGLIFYLII